MARGLSRPRPPALSWLRASVAESVAVRPKGAVTTSTRTAPPPRRLVPPSPTRSRLTALSSPLDQIRVWTVRTRGACFAGHGTVPNTAPITAAWDGRRRRLVSWWRAPRQLVVRGPCSSRIAMSTRMRPRTRRRVGLSSGRTRTEIGSSASSPARSRICAAACSAGRPRLRRRTAGRRLMRTGSAAKSSARCRRRCAVARSSCSSSRCRAVSMRLGSSPRQVVSSFGPPPPSHTAIGARTSRSRHRPASLRRRSDSNMIISAISTNGTRRRPPAAAARTDRTDRTLATDTATATAGRAPPRIVRARAGTTTTGE